MRPTSSLKSAHRRLQSHSRPSQSASSSVGWIRAERSRTAFPCAPKREIERHLKVYVYPRWGSKPFASIRRGVVTELLDDLVDNNGAVQADRVLSTLAKLFNWYRQYDELTSRLSFQR